MGRDSRLAGRCRLQLDRRHEYLELAAWCRRRIPGKSQDQPLAVLGALAQTAAIAIFIVGILKAVL